MDFIPWVNSLLDYIKCFISDATFNLLHQIFEGRQPVEKGERRSRRVAENALKTCSHEEA